MNMNMKKKLFNWTLMAAMCSGLGLTIVACSDDDDKKAPTVEAVTIESDLLTHGIETDMQSAVIEVPVKCNGQWTATLKEGTNWAQILDWQVTFNGPKTLTLILDENLSKVDRSTTLTIGNSAGQFQRIPVRQFYNYKGQAPTNGSGQAYADKGLGTGIDYDYAMNVKSKENTDEKFDPTMIHGLNNIFNISQIEKLKETGKLQASAYVEAPISLADLQAAMLDSSLVQSKHLDVSIDLEVSFGMIEFSAHAAYNSDKVESRGHVDYTIVRNAPMYNIYLSPAELSAYAQKNRKIDMTDLSGMRQQIEELQNTYKELNEWFGETDVNENGLTPDQQTEINNMKSSIPINFDFAGIFSTNFTQRYNELYNAIVRNTTAGKAVDKTAADQTLNALDNEYGPFFIAGGNYGGAMVMHCEIDTMYLKGSATFEGSLSAEFSGLFNVTGDFHYTEEGYNLLRNSNTKINIVGGNANKTADDMLNVIWSGNPGELPKWQGIMKGWLSSMQTDGEWNPNVNKYNQSEATPIMFTITPIWSLFSEPAIQQYAQDFFIEKYRDRGIEGYSNIMHGTMQAPGANSLLNSESDYWKQQGKK